MSNKLIRSLLEARLNNWAKARNPVIRVAFQDVPFTPNAGETYLESFVLPATTDSQTLEGTDKTFRGVWQVNVVKPKGTGLGSSLGIEDELGALFPNNLKLSSGSFNLYIRSPMGSFPALADDVNSKVPVSCQYRADTP